MSASSHRDYLVVAVLGLTQIIGYGTLYYSFSVLAQAMAEDFGWPPEWVFGVFSISLLAGGLAAPVAGSWIDRHGAGKVMSWGTIWRSDGIDRLRDCPKPHDLYCWIDNYRACLHLRSLQCRLCCIGTDQPCHRTTGDHLSHAYRRLRFDNILALDLSTPRVFVVARGLYRLCRAPYNSLPSNTCMAVLPTRQIEGRYIWRGTGNALRRGQPCSRPETIRLYPDVHGTRPCKLR